MWSEYGDLKAEDVDSGAGKTTGSDIEERRKGFDRTINQSVPKS